MNTNFEFVKENLDGSKTWKIKAISVTTTGNNRKYNKEEMTLGARSLSFRPLNRNHARPFLPFPENQTGVMDFDPVKMAVTGEMKIKDPHINQLIKEGKINKLSIEQLPSKGEDCSLATGICEQKGVIFTGLALLDSNVPPGDPTTEIKAEMLDIVECVTDCCKTEAKIQDDDTNDELSAQSADRPDSDFAYVPKDGNPSDRKFPIYDAAHARNALARFNQADLPADKKASVLAKIKHAAKKHGVDVSEEGITWPKIEKSDKLTIDDIQKTYDSMNDSQKAHIIDPNDFYPNTKKFVTKSFKDLNDKQQQALIKTYGFRHSYNDVKHLLPDGEGPNSQQPLFDDDLLGQEMKIKNATDDLIKKGVKYPIAQSMANQDPENNTENNSSIPQSQDNGIMSTIVIKSKKYTKENLDAMVPKLLAKKEINSMMTSFVGQQNSKAPLSDALATILYNASDDELDQYARITADQDPSVIPAGGLPDYKAFTQEMAKAFGEVMKVSNEELVKKLVPVKTESVTPSSVVDDNAKIKTEMVKTMYEYYDVKGHKELNNLKEFTYTLDKTEYLTKYGATQPSGAGSVIPNQKGSKEETVTVSAGDMGQTFAKQVMLLPGGRMRVPVRQYCNFTEIPNGADRANWYTIGSFVFTTITEGTEPTNVAQTVTKIQALPTIRGAVQRVGYSQVENSPFGMVDAINNAMVLAGLSDEANDLLGSGGSYWGTASNVTNWVNGNTGVAIANQNDDIASMTLTRTGLIAAKRLIAAGGYDTSPGNLVLFLHPKAYQDLMTDTNLNTYYQYARPDITATYVLEQLYGVDIVPTTSVASSTNTTNATYRNTLAVKGWALGIAAAREITIEVQRRNEVQQLIISGTHRVKSAVIDYAASCGISSAQ